MLQITVENGLGQKLSELSSQAAICDSEGRVLGYFSPQKGTLSPDVWSLEPPLSIAETEVLRQNKTGKPLSEILARLGLS